MIKHVLFQIMLNRGHQKNGYLYELYYKTHSPCQTGTEG